MLYEFGECVRKIELSQLKDDVLTMGLITIQELHESYKQLGFSGLTVAECASGDLSFRSAVDAYETYSFAVLSIADPTHPLDSRDRIGFYIRRNLLLLVDVVDVDQSTERLVKSVMESFAGREATLSKLTYALLDRLIYRDSKAVEAKEWLIGDMEERLMNGHSGKTLSAEIHTMKKELLVLRSYYEQLVEIAEALGENANHILQDARTFHIYEKKAQRLSDHIQLLRENLVQLREAMDSQNDLELNRATKLLTVLSTVFFPLTLITGWYGMNFTSMGELTQPWGYVYVIGLSAFVVAVFLLIFKRKKLL